MRKPLQILFAAPRGSAVRPFDAPPDFGLRAVLRHQLAHGECPLAAAAAAAAPTPLAVALTLPGWMFSGDFWAGMN